MFLGNFEITHLYQLGVSFLNKVGLFRNSHQPILIWLDVAFSLVEVVDVRFLASG